MITTRRGCLASLTHACSYCLGGHRGEKTLQDGQLQGMVARMLTELGPGRAGINAGDIHPEVLDFTSQGIGKARTPNLVVE